MSISNQHAGRLAATAQQEIGLMVSLRKMPKSPAELCSESGLPISRVKHLLVGLYEAKCIKKVPGTHLVFLL